MYYLDYWMALFLPVSHPLPIPAPLVRRANVHSDKLLHGHDNHCQVKDISALSFFTITKMRTPEYKLLVKIKHNCTKALQQVEN
jgi:hypothetical protein